MKKLYRKERTASIAKKYVLQSPDIGVIVVIEQIKNVFEERRLEGGCYEYK